MTEVAEARALAARHLASQLPHRQPAPSTGTIDAYGLC